MSPHTDLDVMQEKRIDDYVRFLDWIHDVYPIEGETTSWVYVVRGDWVTKIQPTTRPDKSAQKRGKNERKRNQAR